ncbi:MAG: hypothetical protein ABIQ90_05270 [Polaromonas sp.]
MNAGEVQVRAARPEQVEAPHWPAPALALDAPPDCIVSLTLTLDQYQYRADEAGKPLTIGYHTADFFPAQGRQASQPDRKTKSNLQTVATRRAMP